MSGFFGGPTGGGSGTTVTRTTWSGNLTSGIGGGVIITHPAVALGDEEDIQAFFKQEGTESSSGYFSYEMISSKNNETYWSYDDLNTSNRTWINDGANLGHFSGAKDASVQAGCWVKINGTVYSILAITGDGTANSSVQLNADPGNDYAITWIHGGNYQNGLSIGSTPAGGGVVPTNVWYTIKPTASAYPSEALRKITTTLQEFQGGVYSQNTGMRVKMMLTKDGGTTYYYFDGTDWLTADETEWATKGIEYDYVTDYRWEASDGSPMIDVGNYNRWNEFDANLKGDLVGPMWGLFSSATDGYPYIQDQAIRVNENSFWEQLPKTGFSGTTTLRTQRLSATQMLVWNDGMSTLNNLYVSIQTLS